MCLWLHLDNRLHWFINIEYIFLQKKCCYESSTVLHQIIFAGKINAINSLVEGIVVELKSITVYNTYYK